MATTAYKNEIDPPPTINVDLYANAEAGVPLPSPRYYRLEWTTDESLFANASGRTADNFYPVYQNDGVGYSETRRFYVTLDLGAWRRFIANRANRYVYWRLGEGENSNQANWLWSEPRRYQINHMPSANAGPDQRVDVRADGTIPSDVRIIGSGSTDPDVGSVLTYRWTLLSAPAGCRPELVEEIETRLAAASDADPIVLPAGSLIAPTDAGRYEFLLDVTDDDPESIAARTIGRDSARTSILVRECADLCLLKPNAQEPARIERTLTVDITIVWSLAPDLAEQLRTTTAGFAIGLTIRPAGDSTTVTYNDVAFSPGLTGTFSWDGRTSARRPAPDGYYDIELQLLQPTLQPLTSTTVATRAIERSAIEIGRFRDWSSLLSFRPSPDVQNLETGAGKVYEKIHRLEDASGPISLDYYPVRITALPTINGQTLSPEVLLNHVRLNFNQFIDTAYSEFTPYSDAHAATWLSGNPLGAIVHIDMNMWMSAANPDDGSVIASAFAAETWTFSTLWMPGDLGHPVSGNRMWAIRREDDGSYTFFTRGADRLTGLLDFGWIVFYFADALWVSLQTKLADFINANGGSATIAAKISTREDWASIRALHFHPTVNWLGEAN